MTKSHKNTFQWRNSQSPILVRMAFKILRFFAFLIGKILSVKMKSTE